MKLRSEPDVPKSISKYKQGSVIYIQPGWSEMEARKPYVIGISPYSFSIDWLRVIYLPPTLPPSEKLKR